MTKPLKNVIRPVVFLGLGIFLVWFITKDFTPEQWRNIRQVFDEANYWILVPVLFIGVASHYIRALRWRLLLEPVGCLPRKRSMFCAVMIGYLTNLAIPRLGEVARCGIVARQERIAVDSVIGTMVAERLVDVFTLIAIIVATVAIQPHKVWRFFYDHIWAKVIHLFQPGNLLAGIVIITVVALFFLILFYRSRHTRWFGQLKKWYNGIKNGFLTAFRMRQKGLFWFFTFLIWLCYFLMVYIGFRYFDATSALGIGAGLSVLSFGSIGMVVTQGGLGAYQLLVEKTLLLYGVSQIYGFAYGWLSWLAQTALILVLGFGCMLVLAFVKRKAETAVIQKPSN